MLMMIVVCVWRVCPRGSIKDNDNRQQGAILGGPEYSQTLEKHQLFIDNWCIKWQNTHKHLKIINFSIRTRWIVSTSGCFTPNMLNHTSTRNPQFLRYSFKESCKGQFVNEEQRVSGADADCDQGYQKLWMARLPLIKSTLSALKVICKPNLYACKSSGLVNPKIETLSFLYSS